MKRRVSRKNHNVPSSQTNQFWKGRSVLVTGATGLIGSWLVKALLEREAVVTAFVLGMEPQSELWRSHDVQRTFVATGTLEEIESIDRAINCYETDTVFHLGAQTLVGAAYRSPRETFEVNLRGTYNLLEVCRRHSSHVRRILIASSDKAYGAQKTLPYLEEMPLAGKYPYEVSKSCADLIAQSYFATYDLPVAIARCGNVYGGGDLNWSRIVPGTIRALIHGKRPILRSDGTFIRDYVYVKDIVEAYLRLAECLLNEGVKGQAFNFSMEQPLSVIQIVQALQQAMECPHLKPNILAKAPGEIHAQYLSAAKARKLLGWEPSYPLETGLQETVAWYREWFARQGSLL